MSPTPERGDFTLLPVACGAAVDGAPSHLDFCPQVNQLDDLFGAGGLPDGSLYEDSSE